MDELRRHVEFLASKPRPPGSAHHAAVREYLLREMPGAILDGDNIFSELGPRGEPVIVIGAHYDSVAESPGADDNASGVAALIELSKLYRDTKAHLLFAAYDHEEEGMVGSAEHVSKLRGKVRGMIFLEMLGYVGKSQTIPPGVKVNRARGDFLALVANRQSAHLLDFAPEDDFVERVALLDDSLALLMARLSDHAPFWEAGHPALLATDTAFLRNPNYHLASDTPATIDYDFLRRATNYVAAWIERIIS